MTIYGANISLKYPNKKLKWDEYLNLFNEANSAVDPLDLVMTFENYKNLDDDYNLEDDVTIDDKTPPPNKLSGNSKILNKNMVLDY